MGSGKSVFRKIVNSHPNIELTDDFGTFSKIDVSYRHHVKGLKLKWRSNKDPNYYPLSWMSTVRYLAMILLRSLGNGKVGALEVEIVLKEIFPHASVVGDTFGQYALNLDRVLNAPSLNRVVVYRDCRDVAAHIRRRWNGVWRAQAGPWITHNVGTHDKVARHWLKYIRMMEKHSDSIYKIRYEDLVTDPKTVLTQFAQWLGVDPCQFNNGFIHADDVGDYKRVLSEHEVNDILAIAGSDMERLGYI